MIYSCYNIGFDEMKKLVPFIERVVNKYGYKFRKPCREIAESVGGISYVTAMKYFRRMAALGYLTKTMSSRKHGVTYELNKRRVNMLIRDTKAVQEIIDRGL